MSEFMKKIEIVDAIEYGSGDFPTWFNAIIGSEAEIFEDVVYTPKKKLGFIAGRIGKKKFHYGDIIVKHEDGKVSIYKKIDFLRKYCLCEN